MARRFAIGAEVGSEGAHFRVFAPAHQRVEVVERELGSEAPGRAHALERDSAGYHAGLVRDLRAGRSYSFRLGDDAALYPDPASRFQPEGPHGPSELVDPCAYTWRAPAPPAPRSRVLYELHIGTFTEEGSYRAAIPELARLSELGITTLEVMPLAEFPGRFGWGYDGVDLWAPFHGYGSPDDLRAFVDAAHAAGLGVILDVVYNHVGPDGNYLARFAPGYFTDRHRNDWGEGLDFDGPSAGPVREFFRENARYWCEEFRFDGLRLDATQAIRDDSARHFVADIVSAARAGGQDRTPIYVCAENDAQETRVVAPQEVGGFGCDAAWNDDFHHAARVALTGRREAYYHDFTGSSQELLSALRWGYLYQGQHYASLGKQRGQPVLDFGAHHFVTYLQNHDQISAGRTGTRLGKLANPSAVRALTTAWLLAPSTPLLFQGQEYDASTPFLFFADHEPALAKLVARGRREFLMQFQSIESDGERAALDDPASPETFAKCKLDPLERRRNTRALAFHGELLRLRRDDAVFGSQRVELEGACLGPTAFLLRFRAEEGERLVVVNLGPDLLPASLAEPLLAPPAGASWQLIFASEDPRYGGEGQRTPHVQGKWALTATSASVFAAQVDTAP